MAGDLYEQGYYETGTASVTQGQTVVTGQGTAWSQIVRPADDFGKHVGMPVPIASVDSDTQITLAYPWPGPTQTAAPYRVTFTPYHVAYRQALQEIGQLLSSGNVSALAGLPLAAGNYLRATGAGAMEAVDGGNLDALAGLVGENGKFPVFTGAETLALENLDDYAGNVVGPASATDDNVALFDGTTGKLLKDGFPVSAFIRTLLDDTDAAAARGTLGLGSADIATLTGLILQSTSPASLYLKRTGTVTNTAVQAEHDGGSVFFGHGANGSFAVKGDANLSSTPWFEVSSDGPLVGGRRIVEGGSNANGNYVRFADGFQVCWNSSLGDLNTQQALGPLFISSATLNWTFPAAFSEVPSSVSSASASTRWGTTTGVTTTGLGARLIGAQSLSALSTVGVIAFGRWF